MCEASWVFRHPTKMWVCTPSKLATMIICYMLERRASKKEMNIVSSRHWCFFIQSLDLSIQYTKACLPVINLVTVHYVLDVVS